MSRAWNQLQPSEPSLAGISSASLAYADGLDDRRMPWCARFSVSSSPPTVLVVEFPICASRSPPRIRHGGRMFSDWAVGGRSVQRDDVADLTARGRHVAADILGSLGARHRAVKPRPVSIADGFSCCRDGLEWREDAGRAALTSSPTYLTVTGRESGIGRRGRCH